MKINLAMDSGAWGLYTRYSGRKGSGAKGADFSFYKTKKFEQYLNKYGEWIKAEAGKLDFAVSLDVLFDPARSYAVWLELCQHVKPYVPMPVVHFGEDPRWLRKYVGQTDYVGLGGVAGIRYARYADWLRSSFKLVPKNTRMHGFAVTQQQAMIEYPWYSVDSATPWWAASHGQAVLVNGTKAIQVNFSRSFGDRNHFNRMGSTYRDTILKGLEHYGIQIEDLTGQGYAARAFINYLRIASLTETRGIKYYLSGSTSGGFTSFQHFLAMLEVKAKQKQLHWLGTFLSLTSWKKLNEYINDKRVRKDLIDHVRNERLDHLPEPPLSGAALAKLRSRPDPFLFHERPRLRVRR